MLNQTGTSFIVIDFETANSSRSSACSIGIAAFSDDSLLSSEHHYIKPNPLYFDPFNVMIHGITADDVVNAPAFSEMCSDIFPANPEVFYVAHNASFDISVMRKTLDLDCFLYPELDYLCTYRMAQVILPNLGCYRLDYLCKHFDIPLEHHNAESDSIATGHLLLKLLEIAECNSVNELIEKYGFQVGHLWENGYKPFRKSPPQPRKHHAKGPSTKAINELDTLYLDEDFIGKTFVFTGALQTLTRADALTLVSIAGGRVSGSVSSRTNYLVTGVQDVRALHGNSISNKLQKALQLAEAGHNIEIISEEDFLRFVDDELWEAFKQR